MQASPATTRRFGGSQAASERNVMISVETQSRLAGRTIIQKAIRYFGPEGLDLEVSEQSDRSAKFEDCTGFVSITLHLPDQSSRTHVKAIGRKYGAQMHAFIDAL